MAREGRKGPAVHGERPGDPEDPRTLTGSGLRGLGSLPYAALEQYAGTDGGDPRSEKIRKSVEVLLGNATNKAEQIQMLFSLPFQEK